MKKSIQPLFLISLPRSGSTLLNRLIATHSLIASHSEPFLLLPLVFMNKKDGVHAIYNQNATSRAISDIVSTINGKKGSWDESIRNFVLEIYQKIAIEVDKPEAKFFLDKTPKYHIILDEIINIFPNAKFIFLGRNPLSYLASGIETWGKGKLIIHGQLIDFIEGPNNMSNAIDDIGKKCQLVTFEKLIDNSIDEIKKIFSFLEIEYEAPASGSTPEMKGSMGDPVGIKKYGNTVNTEPLTKYSKTFFNPYRKKLATQYIKKIDKRYLEYFGYNRNELINTIQTIPNSYKGLVTDIFYSIFDTIWTILDLGYFRKRLKNFYNKKNIYIEN